MKNISLKLLVVLFKVSVLESNNSDCSLFRTRYISTSVLKEIYRVYWTKMTTYFSYLCTMHDIAYMCLESCLSTSHSCQDSLNTTSHNHMIFWMSLITKQWTNRNRVHWKLLFKVSDNFKSLWIDNFRSVISCSPENAEVFTECNTVDFSSLMCQQSSN